MSMLANSRFALKKLVGSTSVFRHSPALLSTRRGFFGFTLSLKKLIDRVPHELCTMMTKDPNIELGFNGKQFSLKIPGNEKIKETDQGVSIFFDLGLNDKNKDFRIVDWESELDRPNNTLNFTVYCLTTGINKGYNFRVNLPKTTIISYIQPIDKKQIDGGVMVTLYKKWGT